MQPQYNLDQEYLESIYLKTIERKKPEHADPALYGLTQEQADCIRLRYYRLKKKEAKDLMEKCHITWLNNPNWLSEQMWVKSKEAYEKASRDMWWYEHRNDKTNERKEFDIPKLKAISLDKLVHIESNNFFKLRDEKTPSVSWHKKTNTWHDFGSDEHGDSIDLVMKLHNCNFVEACKYLTSLL